MILRHDGVRRLLAGRPSIFRPSGKPSVATLKPVRSFSSTRAARVQNQIYDKYVSLRRPPSANPPPPPKPRDARPED